MWQFTRRISIRPNRGEHENGIGHHSAGNRLWAMQAVLPDGVVFIPSITFDIGLSVSQSRFQYDRQKPFIFTFAVEDCVRRISRAAMRRVESEVTSLGELAQTKEDDDNPDLLKNGSIFSVWPAGFRAFDDFENLEPGKPILTKKR